MTLKIQERMLLTLGSLIWMISPAHALSIDGLDLLDVYIGGSIQHDDNLFRLPEPNIALPVNISSRSDRITSGRLGIGLDKSYGLQRWKLDANFYRYKYANNDFLNYSATNYSARWLWRLTPSVSGNINFERAQQPVNFSDYTNYSQKNIRTNNVQRFDVDWMITGGWHAIAAVSEIDRENSALFTTEDSYKLRGAEMGLKYQFSSGSALSLTGLNFNGTYTNRVLDPVSLMDTKFNQKEIEAKLIWLLTGKSTLNARISHLSREHQNFARRDYKGLVGNLDYVWNITGKILLNGRLERSLNDYQDFDSSYYVNRQLTLSSRWLITDKLGARLLLSSARQNYRGPIRPLPFQERRDRVDNQQLSITWNPTEKIALSGSLQHQKRSSPAFSLLEYTDRISRIDAELRF